jgi:tRNA U34 5-methylaminomethyl-2-thiouridine-forming methyltransferase MnmC
MPKQILTKDGSHTMYNELYDECYHSEEGAWTECHHVFLEPCLRHGSKKDVLRVLDVGFGLGLNWLCFVNHHFKVKRKLEMVSLELDEELFKLSLDLEGIHLESPEVGSALQELKKKRLVQNESLNAKLMLGAAKESLKNLIEEQASFDVILQDPFSPQKNPECWDEEYFELLRQLCKPGAVLFTYSVAGEVRRKLEKHGFKVSKEPGFAQKKEQLVAILL